MAPSLVSNHVKTNLRREAGAQVLIAWERDLGYLESRVLACRKGSVGVKVTYSLKYRALSTALIPTLQKDIRSQCLSHVMYMYKYD